MLKAELLRAEFVRKNSWCRANPERLTVWVERGSVEVAGNDAAFMYRYTLHVLATDFSGQLDDLMLPLLGWLKSNQPDLLLNPDKNRLIEFDADIINDELADILLKVPLWERVIVQRNEDGLIAEHKAERPPRIFGGPWDVVFVGDVGMGGRDE